MNTSADITTDPSDAEVAAALRDLGIVATLLRVAPAMVSPETRAMIVRSCDALLSQSGTVAARGAV